jgi:hypothetical protein
MIAIGGLPHNLNLAPRDAVYFRCSMGSCPLAPTRCHTQAGIIRQLPDYSSVIGNRQLKRRCATMNSRSFVSTAGCRESNIAPVMTPLEVNAGDRIIRTRARGLDG